MKTLLHLLAFLITSASLYAQSTVRGLVQDNTGRGIPLATVALLQASDSAIDEDGKPVQLAVRLAGGPADLRPLAWQPDRKSSREALDGLRGRTTPGG